MVRLRRLSIPSVIQVVGLVAIVAGVLFLFGRGVALIVGGVLVVLLGLAMEMKHDRGDL